MHIIFVQIYCYYFIIWRYMIFVRIERNASVKVEKAGTFTDARERNAVSPSTAPCCLATATEDWQQLRGLNLKEM